jgi:hypothetical protein
VRCSLALGTAALEVESCRQQSNYSEDGAAAQQQDGCAWHVALATAESLLPCWSRATTYEGNFIFIPGRRIGITWRDLTTSAHKVLGLSYRKLAATVRYVKKTPLATAQQKLRAGYGTTHAFEGPMKELTSALHPRIGTIHVPIEAFKPCDAQFSAATR